MRNLGKLQKDYFYLIEFENGIKFGVTDNFKVRLRSYSSPWCKKIMSKVSIKILYATDMETVFKKRYKNFIKNNSTEYIQGLRIEDVKAFMDLCSICFNKKNYKFPISLMEPMVTKPSRRDPWK